MSVLYSAVGVILTAILATCIRYVIQAYQRYKILSKFGSPDGNHFFWGHLKVHPGSNERGQLWMHQIVKKYNKAFYFRLGPFVNIIVATHPDTAKIIMKSSEPKDVSTLYKFLIPWLGEGLLISSGGRWARNRRLLTPAFHFNILKPYMPIYNSAADSLCNHLKAAALDGAKHEVTSEGTSLEIYSPVNCCTLDVILRCAFSMNDENIQNKGEKHPYVEATREAAELLVKRNFSVWQQIDWLYWLSPLGRKFTAKCDYLHVKSDHVITARKKELQANPNLVKDKKLLDFLDILLTARDENGQGLTDAEIRAEVDTFMFEGHDTTASAISWILKELAYHPEDQRRCQEEIDDLFHGRDSDDLLWEDLASLPYTTQCIKEGMRKNTPVPIISRVATKDMVLDGKVVPQGTRVTIAIQRLHNNPHVWGDDVFEFKPERFSPENLQDKDSYAFIPFSAGPRNCIGQNFAMNEIKTTVAKVLHRFNLSSDASRVPQRITQLVTRPEHGLYIRVAPRAPQ